MMNVVKNERVFLVICVLIIILSSFVIAEYVITPSSYNYNEDVINSFNISINNSDQTPETNITQVNISLPSSFSVLNSSIFSDANGVFATYENESILSWTNYSDGLITNFSLKYFTFNASVATPGNYNITVTIANANGSFSSNISVTINDTTAPNIDLEREDDSEDFLNITIEITETGSGINATCTDSDSGTDISGNGTTQYLYEDGLDCGTSYTYNVTCTDLAGNSNSRSEPFSTDSCSDSDDDDDNDGGGGDSTTTTTSFWTKTYSPIEEQLRGGFSQGLKEGERIKVKIGNETHYAGIIELTSTRATVNISSKPQQAVFDVGETNSFEVTGDDYYDIKIKLNSVNTTTANVVVWSVHEKKSNITSVTNTTNTTVSTAGENESLTTTGAAAITGSAVLSLLSKAIKNRWVLIGAGVVIVAAAGTIYYLKRRKRTKGY